MSLVNIIPVNSRAGVIWDGTRSSFMLINLDLTNNVYIDDNMGVNPQNPSTASIPPLGSLSFSAPDEGERSLVIYGKTLTNQTANIQVVLKGNQWAPSPAQVAAQINALGLMKDTTGVTINGTLGVPAQTVDVTTTLPANVAVTGVPLLSKATLVKNQGSHVIGANVTFNLGPFSINQIGYDIGLTLQANAASLFPFMSIVLQWTDSTTGFLVEEQKWVLAGGNAIQQLYIGHGPTCGDTLNIAFHNQDTVNSQTFTMGISQTSRVYQRHDWRQETQNQVPNFVLPNMDQSANWLCQTAPNVNAAGAQVRILPLYAGRVHLWATSGLPFDVVVTAVDGDINAAPAGIQIWENKIAAAGGGIMTDSFDLPRCSCTIQLINNGGVATQIGANVIISEQQL